MRLNNVKALWRQNKPATIGWLSSGDSYITEAMATAVAAPAAAPAASAAATADEAPAAEAEEEEEDAGAGFEGLGSLFG